MRILVVTNMPPAPALPTGGGQRTEWVLRALEDCGEVDLLLVLPPGLCSEEQVERVREQHQLVASVEWHAGRWAAPWRLGLWRLPGALGATARRRAEEAGRWRREPRVSRIVDGQLANGYQLVVARYLEPALRAGLMTRSRTTPLAFDVDDVDEAVLEKNRSGAVERHRRTLQRALDRSDHVWFSNERDRTALPTRSSSVLPNIPWQPEGASPILPGTAAGRDGREILFVGTLGYEPNHRGIRHFVESIWPRVRAAVPDARLRIVGSQADAASAQERQNPPGVEHSGFVDDLHSAYARAAFSIAPLYRGGGPKIKVVESLAHARTCVVTPVAHRGYEETLADDEALLVADDDAAFAEACTRLLRDPALADRLAERGRSQVAAHFGYERFRRIVRDGVERATRSG